jgi:hypothetical protein
MVQKVYETHPAIRAAADRSITGHAAKVEADIAEAMKSRGLHADWTAKDLALHTQAVLQGPFILAKAKGGAKVAADSVATRQTDRRDGFSARRLRKCRAISDLGKSRRFARTTFDPMAIALPTPA